MNRHHPLPLCSPSQQRLHLHIQGMVQGVGFRPFVFGLAQELGLQGWVRNTSTGVELEVEGDRRDLDQFLDRVQRDRPAHAMVAQMERRWLVPYGYDRFEIQHSIQNTAAKSAWILPDLATCPHCLRELFDPQNRRSGYPFTNCTHCGPRYSILTGLPYDRPNTTMVGFQQCPDCQAEYEHPLDRRFHAQPNACPRCGPQLELWDAQGQGVLSGSTRTAECIRRAATWIQQGQILALKGLGGFHLLVDARNSEAVERLRDRKSRPTKPLAVMYPSLALLRQDCQVSEAEATILTSAAAPIVLVPRLPGATLAASIAPHQSTVGVMLPYTPLHHLLLSTLNTPVVATSGNRSQEPMCIDNDVAVQELGQIADGFLVHNRPIARPVDDSVVRMMADQPLFLRRARGYAPAPIATSQALPQILAVGGHLKNTVALSLPGQILVSPYIGDLDAASTRDRCQDTIAQLLDLYAAQPIAIACDAHPDYASTQIAEKLSQRLAVPLMPIQHHYAHVLSGLVDQDLQPPVLGIAWDGTGYGQDGTLWGGEFLAIPSSTSWHRVAHLRPFPLPGGDRAIREPRRAALGLLYAAYGDAVFEMHHPLLNAFSPQELKLLQTMLKRGLQTPLTTSMGRLFDGIAALIGVCTTVTYEGEAAMRLESLCDRSPNPSATYPYHWQRPAHQPWILDWQPMIEAILQSQDSCEAIATQFHNTLVEIIVSLTQQVSMEQIMLTGGCFQNRYLLEQALQRLRASGFRPYGHRQIPCNDGGLSVGQILAATWMLQTAGGGSCA